MGYQRVDVKAWEPKSAKAKYDARQQQQQQQEQNQASALPAVRNANDNSQRQGGLPLGFRLAQPAALQMTDTCTAVITHYDGEDFGIVRTNSQGNGIFHVNTVFFCGSHRLMCKDAECPNYERYDPAKRQQLMEHLLPAGTQVNMLRRAIKNEKFAFQAKLVWPQLSKKPMEKDDGVTPEVSDGDLNVHLMNLKMRHTNSSSIAIQDARRRQQQQFVEPLPYNNRVNDPDFNRAASSPTPPPAPIEPPKRCPLYTEDDPDDYIGKLDKIDHHFKNAFAFTHRTDLVFYPLCTGIMKFRGGNAAVLGSTRLAILKFCRDNEVDVTQEKMDNIMANFKVLFHQISSGSKTVAAPTLARPPSKFGVDIGILNALNEQNRKKKMEKEAREKRDLQLRLVEAEKRKREATDISRSRDPTPSPRPSAASTPSLSEEILPPPPGMSDTDRAQKLMRAAADPEKPSAAASQVKSAAAKSSYPLPSSASVSLSIEPNFCGVSVKSLSSFEEGHNHDPYASIYIKDKQVKRYFSFTTWLESSFAPTKDSRHVMSMARVVLKSLPENDGKNTFSDLKMSIRRRLRTAPEIFSNLLTKYEEQWRFNEGGCPNVAVETIVAAVFSYCWSEIFGEDHSSIRKLIMGVRVRTDENSMYRDQGLIIHYFDDHFGVIQTRHGKVVFDCNVAMRHIHETSGDGTRALKWTRCKSGNRLPIGALVRLNSRVGSFKNNNLIEFRFATKVWSAVGYEEPDISIDIAGGLVYWAEVMPVLESIVKANFMLSSPCDDDPAFDRELYNKYFDAIIQQRYKKGSLPESYDSKKWKSFSNFLTFAQFGKDGAEKHEKTTATVHLLVGLGVSLYDLRKDYLSKALIGSKELFLVSLEQILLNPSNLDVSVPRPDLLCNIAPRMFHYFASEDSLASAQLEESVKTIENNGGSPESLGHVKELVSAVHQYYWNDLDLMFADSGDRFDSSASSATSGNGPEPEGAAEYDDGSSASPSTATAAATPSSVEQPTSSSSSSSGYSTYPNPPGTAAEEACASAEEDNLSSRRTSPGCESGRNSCQGEMDSRVVVVSQAEFDELKEKESILAEKVAELEKWKEEYLEAHEIHKLDVVTVMKALGNRINELQEGLTSRNDDVMAAATIAVAAAGARAASPTTAMRMTAAGGDKCNVQIADKSSKEIYQFSTSEDGDLSVSAVTAIIPGANCLKFKDAASGVTTVCRQVGDIFEVPEGGWGDRTYDANVPPPPPPVSSSNAHVNFAPIGGIGGKSNRLDWMKPSCQK